MFFVIPEMPSKTFVMVLKKLPKHFKVWLIVFIVTKDFTASLYILTSKGLLFDETLKFPKKKLARNFGLLDRVVYLNRFVDGGVPADPGQEALHLPVLHAHTTISMEVIWSRFRLKKSVICIRS